MLKFRLFAQSRKIIPWGQEHGSDDDDDDTGYDDRNSEDNDDNDTAGVTPV